MLFQPPPPAFQDPRIQPRPSWIGGSLSIDLPEKGPGPISREVFLKIKKYILESKITSTYCNMYNNNPSLRLSTLSFFLNPDDRSNTNCNPTQSDFNTLVIYTPGLDVQYILIDLRASRVRIHIDSLFMELRMGAVLSQVQAAVATALTHIEASSAPVP
jgi:hypothetical protein